MIVITGAAGFIGSVLVGALNRANQRNLILVDHFNREDKMQNLADKKYHQLINRDEFISWFRENTEEVEFVFHIGARTDTTEFDKSIFDRLNLNYTKDLWRICTEYNIPMIYASSAATYGSGELGYDDKHELVEKLVPLNPYGESKNDFDKWALLQSETPPSWYGLKFFNVYGPNEYHKSRMASVIFHAFNQITASGGMKLFRSHRPDYTDGGQLRDFVYVKDVVNVMLFLYNFDVESGIYNLGTGVARSFLDLAKATFKAMEMQENIEFVDTPADIRDKYQYYTQANMQKLLDQAYEIPFHTLEQGITDYVRNYLMERKYF
jgi:ADP-L-glycero-D-manno-heptose 6-epimerase